jgi:DNA-binding response OmpR family regulator
MAKSVLIVEDEENIGIALRYLMKGQGYEVRFARDGEEALAMAEESPPDLMLLDVMMPKRDGYDVCQTLRANPACRSIKIIMLSAKGRDIEVEKGLALGADAYMTKPFSTKELAAKVRAMLGEGEDEAGDG